MKKSLANYISGLGVFSTFIFPIVALLTGAGIAIAIIMVAVGLLLMTIAHFMGVDE